MIVLRNFSKGFGPDARRTLVFDDVSVTLPTDRRIAILGAPESGKSMFIRTLSGLDQPDSGSIQRYARLSFPVGYARGLKPDLSARQNTIFAARIYDADVAQVTDFVERVVGLGRDFDEPVSRLVPKARAMFCFALAYAIPFDVYLFDGMVETGTDEFRRKCAAMFEARAETAGMIIATQHPRIAQAYCDLAAVIVDRKLVLVDDIQEALGLFEQTLSGIRQRSRATATED